MQNERFEVVMTLKNPFVFDLDLESIGLRCARAKNYAWVFAHTP